jgi:hypothetical protein
MMRQQHDVGCDRPRKQQRFRCRFDIRQKERRATVTGNRERT